MQIQNILVIKCHPNVYQTGFPHVYQIGYQNGPCLYLQLVVPALEGHQTRIAAEWYRFTNQISCQNSVPKVSWNVDQNGTSKVYKICFRAQPSDFKPEARNRTTLNLKHAPQTLKAQTLTPKPRTPNLKP